MKCQFAKKRAVEDNIQFILFTKNHIQQLFLIRKVYHNMDDIKRYYTWRDLYGNPETFARRVDDLRKYIEEKGIKLCMNMPCYKEELADIGVNLLNKEQNIQIFIISRGEENEFTDIDDAVVKKYVTEKLGIQLYDVRASLDYDIICKKITPGLTYLTEEIVTPNNVSDYEALLFHYIDCLNSSDKTVILTDPYLYKGRNTKYMNMLEHLIDRTSAKEIKSYMPSSCNNCVYDQLKQACCGILFSFIEYDDCHDRFWLCEETQKGFCMGTSLNGIGSKICRVDMLQDNEVSVLLNELNSV